MAKSKRISLTLNDTAAEGLAEWASWLELGEEALAKRLLEAVCQVIASALIEAPYFRPVERESGLILPEALTEDET